MKIRVAILIPAVASIVGCASPVPVAENFPVSYQKVARSAHHWDVVARDVAEQTANAIASREQFRDRGIFVSPTPRNTAFDNAFRNFMINHMVDQEMKVAVCKTETPAGKGGFAAEAPEIVVSYETQVIGHGDTPSRYRPGSLTALAAGVGVMRNISNLTLTSGEENVLGIGLAALLDWRAGKEARPTHTELIVTTTIAEANRFVFRRNDIYYVPDADAELFFQRVSQRYACPPDKATASLDQTRKQADMEFQEARKNFARWKKVDLDMRRFNPNYRPSSPYSQAYSF